MLIDEVEICCTPLGKVNDGTWMGASKWQVELTYKGLTSPPFDYHMGSAYKTAPTRDQVLYCLMSDLSFDGYSFEEFCSEVGHDEDSRKAYQTWESLGEQCAWVKQLFGEDLESLKAEVLEIEQ